MALIDLKVENADKQQPRDLKQAMTAKEEALLSSACTAMKRGTSNRWLCSALTLFWFGRNNREARTIRSDLVINVTYVYSLRVVKVNSDDLFRTLWLKNTSLARQLFIAIGEVLLARSATFCKWNRPRCEMCGHDEFECFHVDRGGGVEFERSERCVKCHRNSTDYLYGVISDFRTNRWLEYERFLFGEAVNSEDF